jgi:hypothetical protein
MNTLELFKSDYWSGLTQHTKKMLAPTLVATVIYFVLVMIMVVAIFSSIFNMEMLKEIGSMAGSNPFDMDAMQNQQAFFLEMFEGIGVGKIVTTFLLFVVIATFVGGWFTNLMLIISQDTLTLGKASVGDAFKRAFNKDILKIVGFSILASILFMLLYLVSIFLGVQVNMALLFVGLLLTFVVMLRFIAVPGAIVHGQMGVAESISFSWQNITFRRALKALLFMMAFGIVAMLIMLLFMAIFGMMGGIGGILSFVFQIAISVLYYAFTYSALSAAFFRYADVEIETDEVGHLLEEE